MADINVDYEGRKLRFSNEPFFGGYDEVRKQIEEEGLRPATFREVVALLFARQNTRNSYGDRDSILEAYKTHPIFGFTALEKRYEDKKYSLIEQDNPEIKDNKIVTRADARVLTGEERDDLRERFYKFLGKTNWQNIISQRSYLYNRQSDAVVPIVSHRHEEHQLSSEERYPYYDDQGIDRCHVVPATYNVKDYNVFREVELRNGKLYFEGKPLRMASFGIIDSKEK
jgi:hypothetical protein